MALATIVRDSDFVGRYGGEEFVMLLPDTNREAAVGVCEPVRTAIGDIRLLEGEGDISASFGVAIFPRTLPMRLD